MSAATAGVAVAVNAKTGLMPSSLATCASRRYSGRKLCPHSEMQWASSTAIIATVVRDSRPTNCSLVSRSGAMYSRLSVPERMRS